MYEEFRQLLIEKLEIEPDLIKPESQLANDLGINSLELAELAFRLEEEFGIEIKDEDIPTLITVGDVANYIEDRK